MSAYNNIYTLPIENVNSNWMNGERYAYCEQTYTRKAATELIAALQGIFRK